MKKKIVLAAVIFTLTVSGCGKTEEEEPQQSVNAGWEKVSEEDVQRKAGKEQQAEAEFCFADVSDSVFYFSSGAGAWFTELSIHSDGTFEGHYQDMDMGDIGESNPQGTIYDCDFTGRFENLEKVDEYTWKMRMASIAYEKEPGGEEIIDGVRYVYSTANGLDGGEEFYIYLPGVKLADLPEEYRNWVRGYLDIMTDTELAFYGLYNLNTKEGFSSNRYEESRLSDNIDAEIAYAEEQCRELEEKLQTAVTQTDMNIISEEIFKTWDDTLNIVWKLLEAELDEETMESLRAEEREWIARKEAEVEAAGAECEGGSIQPLIMSDKAAEMTRDRVYELAEYAKY